MKGRSSSAFRPQVRRLCALAGLSSLLWNFLPPTGPVAVPKHADAAGVAGYHTRLEGPQELLAVLAGRGTCPRSLEGLNDLVYRAVAHGPSPLVRPTDNWFAWMLGLGWSDAWVTQNPRRLARMGVGLCSDAVIILREVLGRSGYSSEMLDLHGHVVCRVRLPEGIWILDPDFGLVFDGDLDQFTEAAAQGATGHRLRDLGHGARRIDAYREIASRATNASVVTEGVLNPRLARLEGLLNIVAWVVPAMLLGCSLLWPRSSTQPPASQVSCGGTRDSST